jgi:DNA processing protein
MSTRPGVAVVGSRRATRYGIGLADGFGASIARAGWSTVSGLARGVDAAAHRGCLRSGGHAAAILGSGVDVCYPAENAVIYDAILANGGAVLSEYEPGTRPDRWRFPARNRIIAAIADAIVVVEAAVTGGALITARIGAEIGRPVFVVPGDVDRELSEGCNRLIKDGAHPVLGAHDLIEELSLVLGPPQPFLGGERVGIPPAGVQVGELPELWSLTVTQAMVKLGKLEAEGTVRRLGDLVLPT